MSARLRLVMRHANLYEKQAEAGVGQNHGSVPRCVRVGKRLTRGTDGRMRLIKTTCKPWCDHTPCEEGAGCKQCVKNQIDGGGAGITIYSEFVRPTHAMKAHCSKHSYAGAPADARHTVHLKQHALREGNGMGAFHNPPRLCLQPL